MRRTLLAALLVPLALLVSPRPSGAADAAPTTFWDGVAKAAEVQKAIAEYFDAPEERRAEIRKFLDDLGALKPADAKKYAKVVLAEMEKHGPKFPEKSGDAFAFGGLSGQVFTGGKAKRGEPLFLALHGGGAGVGDGREALSKWSFVGGKAFVVAPQTPELVDSAWCREDIERWVMALVESARRTFDLDPDRVYVAGHSMGGYGTWSIGCRHADRFAALGACAGGIFVAGPRAADGTVTLAPGHVPNLLDTPIWFYNSTDDKQVRPDSSQQANRELTKLKESGLPYQWIWDEYHDIGHGLPPKGLKPIADWMLERKRNPAPKHVVWEPSRTGKRRFFWLGLERDARVDAKIDGNTVTIASDGSPGATTVFLNDRLVDVEKPVTIVRAGEKAFEGVVPARLSVLLDDVAERRDPTEFHDRRVDLP